MGVGGGVGEIGLCFEITFYLNQYRSVIDQFSKIFPNDNTSIFVMLKNRHGDIEREVSQLSNKMSSAGIQDKRRHRHT